MSIKSNQAQLDKFIIKKDEINIPSRSNDSNNLLEFYLEKNEINTKFLELSKKDKNHVIEIGLINMTTFNNKTVSWTNEDWEQKLSIIDNEKIQTKNKTDEKILNMECSITELKLELTNTKNNFNYEMAEQENTLNKRHQHQYQNDLDSKNELIKNLEDNLKNVKNDFTHEMIEQEKTLKERHHLMFKNDLNSKDGLIKKLEDKLDDINNKFDEQRDKFTETLFEKIKEKDEIHEKEREKLRHEKESIVLDELKKMNAKTEVASIKGKMGERKMMEILEEYRPDCKFEDVGQKGGKGDIIQVDGKYNIMHEVKNYDGQMKKIEITKFLKDLDNNDDIHAGIMSSLNKHIPGKTDNKIHIYFEIHNGKPAFYIGCLSKNTNQIMVGMWMVKNLLDSNINLSDASKFSKITKYINDSICLIQKQSQSLDKYKKTHDKNLKDMKTNLENTIKLF